MLGCLHAQLLSNPSEARIVLSHPTLWWIAAAALVALELAVGTFDLLMLALGAAAGALAAHLGLPVPAQLIAAALVGAGLVGVLYLRRARNARAARASGDPNLQMDIGQTVQVAAWDADGSARVRYRGTEWPARLAPDCPARAGLHRIVALDGNTLVLRPRDAS